MKRPFIFAVLLLLLYSCNPSGNNPDQKVSKVEVTYPEPVSVEFDESKGKASTDKNFYFLFDVSGSMSESCAGKQKIEGAKTAMITFLEKVPDDINIGLLFLGVSENQYGIEEKVILGKNNKEKFMEAIIHSKPDGGTPLTNAIKVGTDRLVDKYKEQLGYGEYRLIIITDGLASHPEAFQQALIETCRYPFIAIYGIGLCMEEHNVIRDYALKYTDASNYEELGKALVETVAELEDFDPDDFNPEDLTALE